MSEQEPIQTTQSEGVTSETANTEHMIPRSRLNEETAKRRAIEAELNKIKEAQLKEANDFKALYEKTLAEKETALKEAFAMQKTSIGLSLGLPKELAELLQGTDLETVTEHAKRLAQLVKPTVAQSVPNAANTDSGAGKPNGTNKSILDMTPEEYLANKTAILSDLKNKK